MILKLYSDKSEKYGNTKCTFVPAQSKPKPRPIPTNPKAIQMNAKIALMKLKGKAAGDKGIPQSERIYFSVCLPLDVKKPPCALFFSQVC